MLDINIRCTHILTKLFLPDFKRRNKGHILNVASSAAFLPGPLLSSYYASKAYVLRLSEAISEELRRAGSQVKISVLCPGPVRTEFNDVAGVRFSIRGLPSPSVAEYAIDRDASGPAGHRPRPGHEAGPSGGSSGPGPASAADLLAHAEA